MTSRQLLLLNHADIVKQKINTYLKKYPIIMDGLKQNRYKKSILNRV